jgi:hypothetical protein
MKIYKGVGIQLYALFNSALDGDFAVYQPYTSSSLQGVSFKPHISIYHCEKTVGIIRMAFVICERGTKIIFFCELLSCRFGRLVLQPGEGKDNTPAASTVSCVVTSATRTMATPQQRAEVVVC